MELNQIIYIKDYNDAYKFAVANNYLIKEIASDETGRRFQIVEKQGPTGAEIKKRQIAKLRTWFDVEYARQEQKFRRLRTLNVLCDDGKDPYDALIELYQEAENKRKFIQNIEKEIENEKIKGDKIDA